MDLNCNHIGDAGASDLAEWLKINHSVEALDLTCNEIGDIGAKNLASALKCNTSLTTLDLSENKFGNASIKELAVALKINASLTTFDPKPTKRSNTNNPDVAIIQHEVRENQYRTTEQRSNDAFYFSKLFQNHRQVTPSCNEQQEMLTVPGIPPEISHQISKYLYREDFENVKKGSNAHFNNDK